VRKVVTGEQVAQLPNPDPFAVPQWRAPVYRTPGVFTFVVQITRLAWRLARFLGRHPVAVTVAALVVYFWRVAGWPLLAALAVLAMIVLPVWRWLWRVSFTRWVVVPARGQVRAFHYRKRWNAVMVISRLAPAYRGRLLLPVLGKVRSTGFTDRVEVRLVSGQSVADFAAKVENLAHGFGAVLCRIRTGKPGRLVLEFVRKDALSTAVPIAALPVRSPVDFKALPVGRREDGTVWLLRLHGTHLLITGATGAGKGSLLWNIVRALLPALLEGTARIWAADPKLMELAFGRLIFDKHGRYAADPEDIAVMLEAAVAEMQATAKAFAGKHREHQPTREHPFTVIIVDEVAFLTAYHPDKALRDRVKAALATLTTQGRAVGYAVVVALQDPRKEVMNIRNLFPDRIAMRLDEPEQVDMVLGDGARDRGAFADLIPIDPAIGAGVAYVRLETSPDPVRVRSAWISDEDIKAMCAACAPEVLPDLREVESEVAA
jgi:S-DNA-T family DNA segregation ATPase FtsK/SpoIIIE